jgi:hypothetical protein
MPVIERTVAANLAAGDIFYGVASGTAHLYATGIAIVSVARSLKGRVRVTFSNDEVRTYEPGREVWVNVR